jgi:hypothetical protein
MRQTLIDPREMRRLMLEVSRGRQTIAGEYAEMLDWNRCGSIIREVFMSAEHQGYSGEDKMTLLAYHALLQLEDVTKRLIDLHSIMPPQKIILEKETPK